MLAILLMLYCIIIAVTLFGGVLMFFGKNETLKKIVTYIMVILCIGVGVISFSAEPDNYILSKILITIISIIPLVGTVLYKLKKINLLVFKLIVIISTIANTVYLIR